jgi:hypothetical protein
VASNVAAVCRICLDGGIEGRDGAGPGLLRACPRAHFVDVVMADSVRWAKGTLWEPNVHVTAREMGEVGERRTGEEAVAGLAARRHGVVTSAQLAAVLATGGVLSHHTAAARWASDPMTV